MSTRRYRIRRRIENSLMLLAGLLGLVVGGFAGVSLTWGFILVYSFFGLILIPILLNSEKFISVLSFCALIPFLLASWGLCLISLAGGVLRS